MKNLKLFIYLFCIVFNVQSSIAQPLTDADKLLELDLKFQKLEHQFFIKDSINYAKQYKNARIAFLGFNTLNKEVLDFNKNLQKDLFMVQLLGVNNPTAIDLKKRILDDLQAVVVKKMQTLFGKDSTKRRGVINTIRNIFNSPIAQDIVKMIPFGNTLSSILTNVGSIVLPEIQYRQNGLGKIIEFNPDVKSIFENVPVLSDLTKELTPYINFYDSLMYINNKFETGIAIIKEKANLQFINLKDVANVIKSDYNWKTENDIDALLANFDSQFLPLSKVAKTNPEFNYEMQYKVNDFGVIANVILKENDVLKKTIVQYENFFVQTKSAYVNLLKRYKSVNKVFETMLTPLIAKIEQLDNEEIALVNSNTSDAGVIAAAKMISPDSNVAEVQISEKDKIRSEIYNTFFYYQNSSKIDKIKQQVFEK